MSNMVESAFKTLMFNCGGLVAAYNEQAMIEQARQNLSDYIID